MKLLFDFKDKDIPLRVTQTADAKEILKQVIDGEGKISYNNNSTLNLNRDLKELKSITITFE